LSLGFSRFVPRKQCDLNLICCTWQGSLADLKHAVEMQPDNAKWLSSMAEAKCRLGDTKVHTLFAGSTMAEGLYHCGALRYICWPLMTMSVAGQRARESIMLSVCLCSCTLYATC